MQATIITIGDEILIGQIVDTNSAWMARELNNIGVNVYEIISISDTREHILSALAHAQDQSDIVLITGGLGPTKDDITKKNLCEYFKDELVINQQVLDHVQFLFDKIIQAPLLDMNRDQALVLSRAQVIHNPYGTAPAMWIQDRDTIVVSMPGVPFEMKSIMQDTVLPKIKKIGNMPFIHHRTLLTAGVGESVLATRIEQWENQLPTDIKLAYLPSLGTVKLRLSSRGYDQARITRSIDDQINKLYAIISDVIITETNNDSLVETVVSLLKNKNKTIAIAESCTGGSIASQITAIPGVSQIFKGATVTYATQSKIDILGVTDSIIKQHSVVSEPVAIAMARQVQLLYQSDYAIATTGNAGPTQGDSDAPVGTVYIGIATPKRIYALQFMMGNHRERVIQKTINKSLELIQKELIVNDKITK